MPGSIRSRSPGVWELRLWVTENGERRQRSRTVRGDERDAQDVLAAWVAELGHQVTDPTMADCLNSWFAHSQHRRGIRDNQTTRKRIDSHLIPRIGRVKVAELTVAHLEQLYALLRAQKGLGDQSIHHLHYIVRPALRQAKRWGWVDRNVAEDIELGGIRRRMVVKARPAMVKALLAALADEPELALFVRLIMVTGARRGEIAALRWEDVDWLQAELHLCRAVVENEDTTLEFKELKSTERRQHADRFLDLDDVTLAQLAGHRAIQESLGMAEGYVFAESLDGTEIPRPNMWSARFRRAKKRAGVDFTLKDLRHLAAGVLLGSGMEVRLVSKRHGHSRTSTTLDVYGSFIPGTATGAADVLAKLLDT